MAEEEGKELRGKLKEAYMSGKDAAGGDWHDLKGVVETRKRIDAFSVIRNK